MEDLNVVLGNWNAGTPPGGPVPEPASMAWVAVSALILRRARR